MMYGNSKYGLSRRGPEQGFQGQPDGGRMGGQGMPQERPFWAPPTEGQAPQFNPQEDQQRARNQAPPQGGPGMGMPAQAAPMRPQAPQAQPMPQGATQEPPQEPEAPQTRYNFGGRRPPMSRFMDGRI